MNTTNLSVLFQFNNLLNLDLAEKHPAGSFFCDLKFEETLSPLTSQSMPAKCI